MREIHDEEELKIAIEDGIALNKFMKLHIDGGFAATLRQVVRAFHVRGNFIEHPKTSTLTEVNRVSIWRPCPVANYQDKYFAGLHRDQGIDRTTIGTTTTGIVSSPAGRTACLPVTTWSTSCVAAFQIRRAEITTAFNRRALARN